MTELKEEHFEIIDANRAKDHEKKNYTPLSHDLFIEESMINGQGLFSSHDLPKETDLGVSHIEFEKDKMSAKELIRTPLGGFINHSSNPNCFINTNIHYHDGQQRELYTTRPIKTGEELTVYYTVGYEDIL